MEQEHATMTETTQSNIEAYTEGIVVACRRPDGRWLFIRRSATVRRPLRVCFPGGWIEAGENQAEAVVREMREELNADVVSVSTCLVNRRARSGAGSPNSHP